MELFVILYFLFAVVFWGYTEFFMEGGSSRGGDDGSKSFMSRVRKRDAEDRELGRLGVGPYSDTFGGNHHDRF